VEVVSGFLSEQCIEEMTERSIINGFAHVIFAVSNWEKSAPFYRELCSFMGMTCVHDGLGYEEGPFLYYVGGRTAFGIQQAKEPHISEKFSQWRPGLHHVCFRVRSVEDLSKIHSFVVPLTKKYGGKILRGPEEGQYAPGYTSFLIEDRDGIRIEWNYVPGKGLLGTQEKKVFAKL